MSGTTGKTSTYIKNSNVKESTQINTGFKKVRFLHQATAGDTLIQLGSLVTPTGAVNYSAPSPTELAQTNLMQWPGNIELVSSNAGRLIQNISYVISGASSIKLLYSALDGEIFEGTIDYGARTGHTLVDATPIIASGTLAAGATDFNVGTPFQVGLYSSYQIGAVMVFVDRALQTRNTGNNAPGSGIEGDYYEVHSGSGLGTIIRFNSPDLVNDRQVMVVSVNGLVERPSGSFMAVMETLQGQIDAMVPTLAALADVSETTFQGTPNNVDLKTFGDRVLTLESGRSARLDELERTKDYIRLSGHNGFGSTNTFIPRFTTTEESLLGTDFSYADSATLGASFTIIKPGKYTFSWSVDLAQTTATMHYGFSKNSTQLSTAVSSITASNILGYDGDRADGSGSASKFASVSVTVQLVGGDVIRAHAGLTLAISASYLSVARVG